MTLHWWMHWFWVTVQFAVILGNPVPSTTTEPRHEVQDDLPSETPSSITSIESEGVYSSSPRPTRQSFRIAKAIGLYPQTNTAVMLERQQLTTSQSPIVETSTGSVVVDALFHGNSSNYVIKSISPNTSAAPSENLERPRNAALKKDNRVMWIETVNKTSRIQSKHEQDERGRSETSERNVSITEVEDLTVLPLQEEGSKFRLVLDRTGPPSSFLSSSSLSSSASAGNVGIRTFNRSDDDVEIDEELAEPQPLATAASILEVGVSRTRSAFPRDFQRDQVQEGNPSSDYNDNSNDSTVGDHVDSSRSAVDIAAITGSCLTTVVLLSTMASLGFIMYRRRYLNPPQTLNSDKCSNPDSSGYIDDSTIRDNSEEMYSLDNDSFLNSLEAMTIQNYWTDSVKHTKL